MVIKEMLNIKTKFDTFKVWVRNNSQNVAAKDVNMRKY